MVNRLIPAFIALLPPLLLVGCGEGEAPRRGAEVVAVTTVMPRVDAVDVTVSVVGTMYGDEHTTIGAKVPGRIIEIAKDFGDRAGDAEVLGRIDPTDYQLELAQKELALREALAKLGLDALPQESFDPTTVATVQRANVQAANARARLERARKLFEQQPPLISEQDFADFETTWQVAQRDYDVSILQAKADLAAARARKVDLEVAQQRLADTQIRTPSLPGGPDPQRFTISRRHVAIGAYVREGDPLFDLVADNPIKFRAKVPQRYAGMVKIGQTVMIQLDDQQESVIGRVSRVNAAIDPDSRMFEMGAICDNVDHRLRPGTFARGSIIVGRDENAVFVPRQAVVSFAGLDKVFTIADGKAVEHRVTRGESRGEEVRVSGDLDATKPVVVEGAPRLARGTAVTVTPSATQPSTHAGN